MPSSPIGVSHRAVSVARPAPRARAVLALAAALVAGACAPGLRPIADARPAAGPAEPAREAEPARSSGRGLPDADYLRARRLMVPVVGVEPHRLTDSFGDPRDGGARMHRAIDIMAPRGTPVLSADDGRVLRVSENRLGGLTVYAIDEAERFVYYYAHMDRYREGLKAGMRLARGELIGYVGTTGNAPENVPHLHFQAMRYRPERYWDGEPVNPLPFLLVAGRIAEGAATANETQDTRQDR